MLIMEDTSEEDERTEDILTDQDDLNHSLGRPGNFTLYRRSNVYYFSNESERGILKRIPVIDGTYRMNDMETVLEKSGEAKTRDDIWSDVTLSRLGSSKTNNKDSETKYEDVCELAYHDRRKTVSKSRKKITGNIQKSQGFSNVVDLGAYKNNSKTIDKNQDTLKFDNKVQKEKIFLKPFKATKKRQPKTFGETVFKNIQGSVSNQKYKKFSTHNNTNSSSKKPKQLESDVWTEERYIDALSNMFRKSPQKPEEVESNNEWTEERYIDTLSDLFRKSSNNSEEFESNNEWTEKCSSDALSDMLMKSPKKLQESPEELESNNEWTEKRLSDALSNILKKSSKKSEDLESNNEWIEKRSSDALSDMLMKSPKKPEELESNNKWTEKRLSDTSSDMLRKSANKSEEFESNNEWTEKRSSDALSDMLMKSPKKLQKSPEELESNNEWTENRLCDALNNIILRKSSQKAEDLESSNEWTEKRLSDALKNMLTKTPITEL